MLSGRQSSAIFSTQRMRCLFLVRTLLPRAGSTAEPEDFIERDELLTRILIGQRQGWSAAGDGRARTRDLKCRDRGNRAAEVKNLPLSQKAADFGFDLLEGRFAFEMRCN